MAAPASLDCARMNRAAHSAKEERKYPDHVQGYITPRCENAAAPISHSLNWSPCYLQRLRPVIFLISIFIGFDSALTKCFGLPSHPSNSSSTKCVPKPSCERLVFSCNESGEVTSMSQMPMSPQALLPLAIVIPALHLFLGTIKGTPRSASYL